MWYRALSLRYACIRSSSIILIPWLPLCQISFLSRVSIAELARGENRVLNHSPSLFARTQSINQSLSLSDAREPKIPLWNNRPQKYPFPWTDWQTLISASSMDPSDLRCQTAAGCDLPFFHNALDRRTDRPTDRTFTGKFGDYRPLRSESDAA